ncbi:MAG: transposase [Caedimonas sp.]|nr:transposase [Caedimonas sp.]
MMSRHKCTRSLYTSFLQASSIRYSGLALSEVSPVPLSHDSVNRWLSSCSFRPSGVWELSKPLITMKEPCLLIGDDTVLDKRRSEEIALVKYQYSGTAHAVMAGIGLVNLVWHGLESEDFIPVDYRVYDKDTDGKTKNDHFRDMLKLAKDRGLTPDAVVMDAWYSSLDNLKAIRAMGWIWVMGLKKNRKVNRGETLEKLPIPDEGLKVHLRGYGWITVFRFVAKNGRTDYIATNRENPSRDRIETIIKARWKIEVYHRELKQTCGLERCQSRTGRAQRNHIFLAISAWIQKYKRRLVEGISFYQQKWEVIKNDISREIHKIMMLT